MAVNDKLKKDLNRLVVPVKRPTGLPIIGPARAVTAQRGSGLRSNEVASSTSVAQLVRKEVISIYSYLVITEDGAFERPAGWPADGAYPAGTPVPSPLPDSLIDTGGTLSLDTSVPYYEQRRVHVSIMDRDGVLDEEHFLVKLEAPFVAADSIYVGLITYSSFNWNLPFKMIAFNNGNANVDSLINTLLDGGIAFE